jgi:hypothetical protein
MAHYNEDNLEKEKDKLNRLVVEALENGSPIAQNYIIIEHSCKVDALVVKAQKEKKRPVKKQQER